MLQKQGEADAKTGQGDCAWFLHDQHRLFSQELRYYRAIASFIFFPSLPLRYARSARDLVCRADGGAAGDRAKKQTGADAGGQSQGHGSCSGAGRR